jgi:post-segregation antitoxin (ccd killing protein)
MTKQRPLSLMRAEREKHWLRENRSSIASINAFIDRHGLLANRMRLQQEWRWSQENPEAIAQYNRRVAEEGLLSDSAGLL